MKKSLLIIGSGLSGLSAGTYAQRSGLQATIFEQHYHAGGYASFWKRKELLIDGGIYTLMGYSPKLKSYELLRDLGAADPQLYVPMKEFATFIDEASGKKVSIGSDLNKLEQDLKAMAPKDAGIVEEVVGIIKGLRGKDLLALKMLRPPELENALTKAETLWRAKSIIKYMNDKYSQPMEKFTASVKSEPLKNLLNGIFSPKVPVWYALTLVASAADGQTVIVKNGCKSFVSSIENNYKSLGGKIRCKSKVTKILTEDNKACGIQLASGEQIKGDYIVSAGDSENAIYNLLGGKYITPEIDKIHKTWKPNAPYMLATYCVNQEFPNEPPINHLHLKEPINYGDKQITELIFRIMNYGDFAPKGKTIVQVKLSPTWEYWHELSKDKPRYSEEKKRFSREILEKLDAQYPGMKEKVEFTDVATPWTMHRFTMSKNGSASGWESTAENFGTKRYRTISELKNFYMAGQWAFSGGVVPVLYSGKHVIDLINSNY
eukprot:TRINITY_DN1590_c0_g1_i4.p1 TRINITY_DN1590_c0_g1~~TRINITY_DN1590_c0_g1_i4.p1  ORF type:complete len:490 (+),score=120.64 TRINITY_DN1590_c0_g1_i4:484-1953(+)